MSAKFCGQCGSNLETDASFCPNCGKKVGTDASVASTQKTGMASPKPQPQQPPMSHQSSPAPQNYGMDQPYSPQPYENYGGGYQYQKGTYIRPPNYVFTKTIFERLIGTFKRDINVIEEIEEREDLQQEANALLLSNFIFGAIFSLLVSTGITPFDVLLTFVYYIGGGYVFVYALAYVGQSIGGQGTQTNKQEMIRVTSYAYVTITLAQIGSSLSESIGGLSLIFFVFWVYALVVFVTVVSRSLDKGVGTALVTIIFAGLLWLVFLVLTVFISVFLFL